MRHVRRFGVIVGTGFALAYLGGAALRLSLPGLGWYDDWRFTRDLTGANGRLGDPVASYETPRAFNGDGYSIARYRLPPALARRFAGPRAAERLAGYPVRPWYRGAFGGHEAWVRQDWRPTTAAPRDTVVLRAALDEAPPVLRAAAEQALTRRGSWYALRYKADPGTPWGVGNVDLFLADPAAGALFVANMNM